MKKAAIFLAFLLVLGGWMGRSSGDSSSKTTATIAWPSGLPRYEHVVIVVEENKDYDQIIDQPEAPYINMLRKEGANFTKMFGEEHNSQGNYYWLFSGSNHNVGFDDVVPDAIFDAPNLGKSLIDKNRTFKGYAESLDKIGSMVDSIPPSKKGEYITLTYGRKHVPWTSFSNVPNGTTVETSSNLTFNEFPSDFSKLPTVAFVIPNMFHDMHNVDKDNPKQCIKDGDKWLRDHLDGYYQWAKKNNSLLIVTFDENDDKKQYTGLTNPFVKLEPNDEFRKDLQNRTCTIFAGAYIEPGDYEEGKGITHVNILRTLEAMYGLPKSGAQQPNAAGGGITDDYIITDVLKKR